MKTKPAPFILAGFLLCALLLSTSAQEERLVQAQRSAQAEPTHKVIAPPGLLDPNRQGIDLLQDYTSFALFRLSESALAGLAPGVRSQVQVVDFMDRITLGDFSSNPSSPQVSPSLPADLMLQESAGPRLELVQFVGPVKEEWLAALEAAGSHPVHYVASNAYLVWTDAAGLPQLDVLLAQADFLQYRGDYQPYFKLGASLRQRARSLAGSADIVPVVIQLYRHEGSAASKAEVARLSLEQLSSWTPVLEFENILVKMRLADIPAVASLPDVTWIGERRGRERLDEVQGQILASNMGNAQNVAGAPGYISWLDGYGFSRDPDEYPVIDITDDGIGDGSLDSGDPTLHREGIAANPSRLAYLQDCTADGNGGGLDGHGHLNASIAGGYDARSGFPYQDSSGFNLGLGVNPFGRLGGTRVFSMDFDISNCGGTDTSVIRKAYTAGGRISSNSWGCSTCASEYDESSQAYDVGVRDADLDSPGNQSMTFIFAAGNSGLLSQGSIGTPGNAKNVITVGASESIRPTWTDGCLVAPAGADSAMDIAVFSSRGPAPGGRVKPDLVAPGTHIQGTASTNPGYTGIGLCDPYQPSGQEQFTASSGTSHSAPAVAGVASLYTWWLQHTYALPDPSPAMIKAYLIAHTRYLTGADAGDNLPSNSQGFGLPDMSAAFDAAPRFLLDQSVLFDRSGQTWTFNGAVADPSLPVRIVLAYTDQAGMLGASPDVNNLDLKVVLDDQAHLGNHFEKQWSVSGGEPDGSNNVEVVYLPPGSGGNLDITVTAFNISGDGVPGSGDSTDQDFALVCYNCRQVARQDVCAPQSAEYTLTVGALPGLSGPLTLIASGGPPGALVSFDPNPVPVPGASRMTVAQTADAPPGRYMIDVTGTAAEAVPVARLELNLFNRAPSSPVPIAPTFAAVDQPARPVFLWSPSSQAVDYEIEIAADSQFTDLVLSDSGLESTQYQPFIDLSPGRLYYWRVRSRNPCGASAESPASILITAPAPGECSFGSSPQVLYSEDFESGAPGWNHTGSGDTWSLTERGRGGSTAYGAKDPAAVSDQSLTSPPVSLPGSGSPAVLKYWNAQSLEKHPTAGCYDGAVLEITTDRGGTWKPLQPGELLADPYDGRINSLSNPLYRRDAWCGDPQDWVNSVVDLAAYAGQSVQFRFRLGSDSSIGRDGWIVDDLAVQKCELPVSLAYLGPDSILKGMPGEKVIHHFTLRNLGKESAFDFAVSGATWPIALLVSSSQTVAAGGELVIPVEVTAPPAAQAGSDSFTLIAIPDADPEHPLSAHGTTVSSTQAGVWLSPDQAGSGRPGDEVEYTFTITNIGGLADRFALALAGEWEPQLSSSITDLLDPGEVAQVLLKVHIPSGTAPDSQSVAMLRVTSTQDGGVYRDGRTTTRAIPYQVWMPIIGRK